MRRRTIVSLTFDDGTADHFVAAGLLAERGLVGTFYVNSGRVGSGPEFLDWEQLAAMAAMGHEIGGHSADHLDLSTLDDDAVRGQVALDRSRLLAQGHEISSFAYPYGSADASVRSVIAEAGYLSARRAWGLSAGPDDRSHPPVESLPPADRFAVRTIPSIESGTRLEQLQHFVERSHRSGGWIPLVFHGISGRDRRYEISTDVFRSFLDLLIDLQGRVDVCTVRAAASIG